MIGQKRYVIEKILSSFDIEEAKISCLIDGLPLRKASEHHHSY